MKLLKSEKIAVHDVESLLDQIWQLYDTEGLGSLDARNVKQLLKDFTGHEVDESMCKDFLESVDEDGDSKANGLFSDCILNGVLSFPFNAVVNEEEEEEEEEEDEVLV